MPKKSENSKTIAQVQISGCSSRAGGETLHSQLKFASDYETIMVFPVSYMQATL